MRNLPCEPTPQFIPPRWLLGGNESSAMEIKMQKTFFEHTPHFELVRGNWGGVDNLTSECDGIGNGFGREEDTWGGSSPVATRKQQPNQWRHVGGAGG